MLTIETDRKGECHQTVVFPSIRTCALDAVSGMHLATAGGTVIKDTIAYTGLVPGASYIAKGTLMDAGTGKPVSEGFLKKVTGETEFVPKTADGEVEVSFGVDTAALAGSTAVVFEEVFLKTDAGKEIPAAEHKDLSDTDQQVRIPEIRTSASVDGEKECTAGKDTELVDTVTYRNLLPLETYVLKGKAEKSRKEAEGNRTAAAYGSDRPAHARRADGSFPSGFPGSAGGDSRRSGILCGRDGFFRENTKPGRGRGSTCAGRKRTEGSR